MAPTFGNGKICYVELPAVDIDQSADFYQNVFGWHIRQNVEGGTSFDDGVSEVSGTWRTDRRASGPGLLIHIMVSDILATVEKALANGGQLIKPIVGKPPEYFARISDPAGNVIGLFQQK